MGTDEIKLAWDKGKELSFSVKDCTISDSMLDDLKVGEVCYGTTAEYKPIRISYDEYPTAKATITKTVTREQEQIETLIRAVANLIEEVEALKKDNAFQYDKIILLEEENRVLKDSMEEMYIEMVAIKDKTIILESKKADKEIAVDTSALASCC